MTRERVRASGCAMVLIGVALPAGAIPTELPFWDPSPLIGPAVDAGALPTPIASGAFGPTMTILLAALALVGTALVLWVRETADRAHTLLSLALLVPTLVALFHVLNSGAALDTTRTTTAWLSGYAALVAFASLRRDDPVRRALIASVAGLAGMFAVVLLYQTFVELPRASAAFRADPDSVYAARGWEADSPMARAFARRATQHDPTGFFALSNVAATFAGVGMLVLGGLSLGAWRAAKRIDAGALALGLGALACALALVRIGSKGAFAALAFALLISLVIAQRERLASLTRRAPASALAAVIVALPTLAIIARGFVGAALGELSLLFRWFYLQAATRIAGDNPLLGAGPEGFASAYLIDKNPISPEDVQSAHNLLAQTAATLGLPAFLALAFAFVLVLRRAGQRDEEEETPRTEAASPMHPIALLAAIATIVLIAMDRAYLPDEGGAIWAMDTVFTRLVPFGAFVAIAWATWRLGPSQLGPSVAVGAASMLVVHSGVEVTGDWISSAPLFFALLGLCAPVSMLAAGRTPPPSAARWSLAGVPGALGLGAGAFAVFAVWPWENDLRTAAGLVSPVGALTSLDPTAGPESDEELQRLQRLLAAEGGGQPAVGAASRLAAALERLDAALTRFPRAWTLRRSASETAVLQADVYRSVRRDRERAEAWDRALALFDDPSDAGWRHTSASSLWESTLARTRADQVGAAEQDELLERALAAAERASELSPFAPEPEWAVFELSEDLGARDRSRRSAARLLEIHENMALDQAVRGLTEAQIRRIRRVLDES